MAILVTGAAGFIGSHVVGRLLQRGEEVVGIDNLNEYYSVKLKNDRLGQFSASKGFRFFKTDFADECELGDALSGITIEGIIHLGAQAGVRYSIANPRAYVRSNLAGHLNILEVARNASGCRHLVYASSSSVYGANRKLPFSVEDRVDQPVSLYAATKKADELMSEAYSHLYRISMTGLRFFTVYGPWGRPDMAMWLFSEAILAGRPIKIFNRGDMRRDFTYIDDIVSGVIACYDNPPPDDRNPKAGGSLSPHRLYNIGNHKSENLLDMIDILEDALGRKAYRELLPMQDGDVAETFADIEAISTDIGFHPTTSIDVGIPRFVDWFRAYHKL